MTDGECRRSRRTAKSDPLLEREALFSREINATLLEELPLQCRGAYFTRANMPAHWLEAILENQESYRRREKSVALDFRELPSSIVAEFAWSIERQAQLGMRVSAQYTTKLARQIALVLTDPHHACISSLLDLPRDEWLREISRIRIETGSSLAAHQVRELATVLGRILDLLVHAYHRGEWWHPDVWNPLLDTRIPLREHEPLRHSVVNFSHLTTPWLRAAAKWWLSRQLERQVYTWSTIHTRQKNLVWFQNYLELNGHDGPCIVDDQTHLGPWVQGFRRWVARQKARTGPAKGSTISAVQRRAAMTAPEQLYRFLFEEQHAAAHSLDEPRWLRLQPQHAVLFRFGDKPSGPKTPPPDAVLSDAVISRIAEHSDLLGRAKVEGGFGDDQLVRILGLLIQTGRRVREITALSYDPLLAVPFPDLNGHAARLRYQQTKIITDDSTILVDQEIVDLIRKQQDYALAFMSRQGKPDLKPKYLFLARNQNRNGDRPYPMSLLHIRLRQFSDRIDLRDDSWRGPS